MIMSLSHQYMGHVVTILRMYFITKVGLNAYDLYENHSTNTHISEMMDKGLAFEEASIRFMLMKCCESMISIFSLASFISLLSKTFHHNLLKFMLIDDIESSQSAGTLAGCLFIIVCFQCGLTSLPDEDRYYRLLRNLGLIFIVNLHALYKPVSDRLQSLSTSRSKTVHKHLRVLSIGLLSIFLPITLLIYLWSHSSINSWTMAVAVFGFEMVFRVSEKSKMTSYNRQYIFSDTSQID